MSGVAHTPRTVGALDASATRTTKTPQAHSYGSHGKKEAQGCFTQVLGVLDATEPEEGSDLAAVVRAETTDELEAVFMQAISKLEWTRRRDFTQAALTNKVATADQVERFLARGGHVEVTRVIEKRIDNIDVVVALLRTAFSYAFDDDYLAGIDCPGATTQELWNRLVAAELSRSSNHLRLTNLLGSRYADVNIVGKLPFRIFAEVSHPLPGWVLDAVLALVNSELGNDADLLENFELLGEKFTGSIEDLLTTVKLHSKLARAKRPSETVTS